MKSSLVLLFAFLQVLMPGPGYTMAISNWQKQQDGSEEDTPPLPSTAAMCILLRCPDISGEDLRSCYHRKCSGHNSHHLPQDGHPKESAATCMDEKCPDMKGELLKSCAIYKCADLVTSNDLSQMVERRGGVRGMWPDEFETRMVERGMWPDEYETRDVGRRGIQKKKAEKRLVRRTRSDFDPADIEKAKLVKKTVKKRWSSRICMESRCKDAHSKVQYFMCGQMHCHR